MERRDASKNKIEVYRTGQAQAKERGLDLDALRRYESGLNAAAEDLRRIHEKNKKIEEGTRLTSEQEAKVRTAREQGAPAEAAYKKTVGDEEAICAKVEALNSDLQSVNAQESDERALATLSKEIADSESEIKKASEEFAKDEATLKERSQALEALKADLEKARLADEATSIAARVHPGDDCPVCQQVVPADFKPHVPDNLRSLSNSFDTVSREVERLRASIGAKTQYCESEQKKQQTRIRRRDELQASLAGRMDPIAKRLQLKGKYDAASIKLHIDKLLKTERAALAQARKATLDANTALEHAKNLVKTAEMRLKQYEERLTELSAEKSGIEKEYSARFERFPKEFVPATADVASVDKAKSAVNDLLVAAKASLQALQQEQSVLNGILEEERDLQKMKYERVDIPAQKAKAAFEALCEDLTTAYELVKTAVPEMPAWSSENLAAATKAASALEKTARAVAKTLKLCADELEQDARKHAGAIGETEQKYGGTIDDIRQMCVQAEAVELNYKQQKAKLAEIMPKADELDALIAPVDELQMIAGELMGVLTPGKFLQFALSEKQTALLAIASDTFKRMTGGRFGFAEKFQIIDNDWASERSAHTLSGGETFIASLALALSLVEMASRSGGRLEGFFLDEGFGSLDQEYLDAALEELERHASKGRIVGLISHIRDIAERVPTILHVQRTATGSRLRTVSDPEREDFIEAGLERAVIG